MADNRVPLEYFLAASDNALSEFALTRLAHASNLSKDIKRIEDERIAALESAGVAQWLIENRGRLLRKVEKRRGENAA